MGRVLSSDTVCSSSVHNKALLVTTLKAQSIGSALRA
jgi:hypothetical protein